MNLKNSFPEKKEIEVKNISKKYYQHFCDLIIESIRLFSMSEKEAIRRCKCRNPEVLQKLFEENKSLVLGCGHFNNWELTGVSFAAQVPHQILCIYTPLSNKFWDARLRASREQYGARLIPKKEIRQTVEKNKNIPSVIVFGTDQNPSPKSNKLFWTDFMNQDTAVNFGMEKYATDYDLPAYMMKIHKMKRGYYEFEFEKITNNSSQAQYGSITLSHTRILEKQIREHPPYWLWTHKRWKRTRELIEEPIYHFTTQEYFSKFKDKSFYFPEAYKADGFIHCCFKNQFEHVKKNYFKGMENVLVLELQPSELYAEVKLENLGNEQDFPHIYGFVNVNAISKVTTV